MSQSNSTYRSFPQAGPGYAMGDFGAAAHLQQPQQPQQQQPWFRVNAPGVSPPVMITPRSLSNTDVDLSPFDANAGSAASTQPLHTLTRSIHDPAWTSYHGNSSNVFQRGRAHQHVQPQMQLPRPPAMRAPASNLGHSEASVASYNGSEPADSGYGTPSLSATSFGVDNKFSPNMNDQHEAPWPGQPAGILDQGIGSFKSSHDYPQSPRTVAVTDGSGNFVPVTHTRRGKKRPRPEPCQICRKEPKNASDAKKHRQTHDKPFLCDVAGCTRREGFATRNDLERHKKNVHQLDPAVGTKSGFICAACHVPEGELRKFWPRRDNFSAHVQRKHKDMDSGDLIRISLVAERPPDTRTEGPATHVPSQPDEEDRNYQQPFPSPPHGLSRQQSQQGFPMQQQDSAIAFTSAEDAFGHIGAHADLGMYNNHSLDPYSHLSGNSTLDYPPTNVMRQPHNQQYLGPQHAQPLAGGQNLDTHYGAMHANEQTPDYSQWMHRASEPSSERIGSQQLSLYHPGPECSNATSTEDGRWQCPRCDKVKPRECDLKKHLKRHTRPYGCTFPDCDKNFGSRNDWKRHECSQHYLLESWKCARQSLVTGALCHKPVFSSAEALDRHLQGQHHKVDDLGERQQLCEEYRLGPDGHAHFWCGFCNKSIPQKEECYNAREERFSHIGDHYDKQEKKVEDWVCIQYGKAKKDVTDADRKKARKAARTGKNEDSEDEGESPWPDAGKLAPGHAPLLSSLPAVQGSAATMFPHDKRNSFSGLTSYGI